MSKDPGTADSSIHPDLTQRIRGLRDPADPVQHRDLLGRLESKLFQRPTSSVLLSRYVLQDVLGAGGMGVVYAAHDPELDRNVAIKLMRAGERVTKAGVRADLLREARAIARLAHPNVVAVYDVGTYRASELWGDSQVRDDEDETCLFVVMERVHGSTLDRWLTAKPRSLRRLLDVFLQAGRGLAAAHEVGVVHRDFKPTNVIVGEDGRARVLDFGLARQLGDSRGSDAEHSFEGEATLPDTTTSMIETGIAIGTPAYMAPEQHRGEHGDARSDQYSFCITLFEALTGRRPFEGRSLRELGNAKIKRLPPFRSPGRRIPSELRRMLRRGLSPRPSDRFDSMAELLAVLERYTTPRRPLAIAAVGSLAIGATVSAAVLGGGGTACPGADAFETEGTWDAAAHERVRRALLASPSAYASTTWQGVQGRLDRYVEEWRDSYRRVCGSGQDTGVVAVRQTCLRRRHEAFAAFVDLVGQGTPEIVGAAVTLADELPQVSECEAVSVDNPDDVRSIGSLVAVAQAHALEAAGERDKAIARLLAELEAQGPEPMLADRAQLERELATIQRSSGDLEQAEASVRRAWKAAESADDAMLSNRTMITLCSILRARGRPQEARDLLEVVAARVDPRTAPTSMIAQLRAEQGLLALQQDQPDVAVDHLSTAEGLWLEVYGGPSAAQISIAIAIASARAEQGDLRAATVELARIRDLQTERLGVDHPQLASIESELARVLLDANRPEEAIGHALEAIRILEATPSWGRMQLSEAYGLAAILELMLGHAPRAHAMGERLITLVRSIVGEGHVELADAHSIVALADLMRGRPLAALASLDLAQHAYDRAPESHLAAEGMISGLRADALRLLGDLDNAHSEAERSLKAWQTQMPEHQNNAHAHTMVAMVLALQGRDAEAVEMLGKARGLYEHSNLTVVVRGQGLLMQGEIQMELGLFDEAAVTFEQADAFLAVHPNAAPNERVRNLVRQATVAALRGLDEQALRRAEAATELAEALEVRTEATAMAYDILAAIVEPTAPDRARVAAQKAEAMSAELEMEPAVREEIARWHDRVRTRPRQKSR